MYDAVLRGKRAVTSRSLGNRGYSKLGQCNRENLHPGMSAETVTTS